VNSIVLKEKVISSVNETFKNLRTMNRVRKHEDNSCFDHQDDKIELIIDFFLFNFMYFLFALSFLEKKQYFMCHGH